jgi:hypothetical protein
VEGGSLGFAADPLDVLVVALGLMNTEQERTNMNQKLIDKIVQEAFDLGIKIGRIEERIDYMRVSKAHSSALILHEVNATRVALASEHPNVNISTNTPDIGRSHMGTSYHSSMDYATQGKRDWR